MAKKEIPLWLDSYQDIFSDFDPRPYKNKALSSDFLAEIKRASKDKNKVKELKLLVPNSKRNKTEEKSIKKRLGEHFEKHFNISKKEKTDVIKNGIYFFVLGIFLMIVATFILLRYEEKGFLMTFLVVFLEPGGWFLFWEGLDLIIFETKKIQPELDFYRKMLKTDITFLSY